MTTTLAELDKLEAEAEAARLTLAAADRRLKDAEFRYSEVLKLAHRNNQPPPQVVADLRRDRDAALAAMNAFAGHQTAAQIELVRPYWKSLTTERWASIREDKAEIVSLARQLRAAEEEAGMPAEAIARSERYHAMANGPLTPDSDPSTVLVRLHAMLREARAYAADCVADARLRARLGMPARKAASRLPAPSQRPTVIACPGAS
jgi:hypothetical protein